jgi:hypothetical protein
MKGEIKTYNVSSQQTITAGKLPRQKDYQLYTATLIQTCRQGPQIEDSQEKLTAG